MTWVTSPSSTPVASTAPATSRGMVFQRTSSPDSRSPRDRRRPSGGPVPGRPGDARPPRVLVDVLGLTDPAPARTSTWGRSRPSGCGAGRRRGRRPPRRSCRAPGRRRTGRRGRHRQRRRRGGASVAAGAAVSGAATVSAAGSSSSCSVATGCAVTSGARRGRRLVVVTATEDEHRAHGQRHHGHQRHDHGDLDPRPRHPLLCDAGDHPPPGAGCQDPAWRARRRG